MKKKVLMVLVAVITMATSVAQIYDFSATAPSGQTLYYKIISGGSNVAVVRPGFNDNYNNYVTGSLTIPSSVSYNGTTYTVTALASSYYVGSFSGCPGLTSVTIPNSVTTIVTVNTPLNI